MTANSERPATESGEERLEPQPDGGPAAVDNEAASATTIDPDSGAAEDVGTAGDSGAAEDAGATEDAGDSSTTGGVPDGATCDPSVDYLDALSRLKAEFANFRRRAADQQAQAAERGAAELATRLLPVLDASEAGAAHDSELVGPLHGALLEALRENGLEVISPAGERFDPNFHEAVLHTSEENDGEVPGEPVVTEVLRTGYAWKGRVLRPAAVGVRG